LCFTPVQKLPDDARVFADSLFVSAQFVLSSGCQTHDDFFFHEQEGLCFFVAACGTSSHGIQYGVCGFWKPPVHKWDPEGTIQTHFFGILKLTGCRFGSKLIIRGEKPGVDVHSGM
jgi:hypothetical protein